jgi:hypothetical protein
MPAVFSDRFSPKGDHELMKVALARQYIPAEANALLSAWIEGERPSNNLDSSDQGEYAL